MIKLVYCLRRRPELSREEFQRYWREQHAGLALKNKDRLGLRRYVQVHTLRHEYNDAMRKEYQRPEAFDGIAEGWFESIDQMASVMHGEGSNEALREMIADERNFIDLERSPIWIAEEHPIFER